MNMEIRKAALEDIPQIIEMKKMSNNGTFEKRIHEMETGNVDYLVAEEDRKILGHVFLKYYSHQGQDISDIEDLFVRDDVRGQGIGTKLVEECERLSRKKGFKRIGLAVNPTLNPKAKELYEKLGYKETGKPPYLDGIYDGVEDWVVDLAKNLF